MAEKMSKTRAILEEKLHNQLGTTPSVLKTWETDPYPVDGKTVSQFWNKIEKASAVRIVGDYDVDGICASHILSTSIRSVYPNKKVSVRIPRRFSEGYGINDAIADEIITSMPAGSLVITVDNGIAAAPVLERIKQAGFEVVVTDHHEAREGLALPKVDMLIDPAVKSLPNPFAGRYWCGAAVAYKLCEPIIDSDLSKELEAFAGLATVSDCMELKEGNWGLVRRAIKTFREKKAPESLKMLLSEMGQDPNFCNEEHFGFYLGPAFNAPGRLMDKGAVEVLKFLYKPTKEGCEALVEVNNERKRIRDEEFEIVKRYIAENGLENNCPIWVSLPGLHEGIVGILAGKVAEEYKRPTIVVTNLEHTPGMLKGSARSFGDFNIFEYLSGMHSLFEKMGGHKGAAGLSITEKNFELASKNLLSIDVANPMESKEEPIFINKWEIPSVNKTLGKFRPFGEGNTAPKFEVNVDMEKDKARMIGKDENKVHLMVQDEHFKWKLTHFNHLPNELANKQRFGLRGTISGSAFAGKETPNFNADEAFDLVDDMEKGR